MIEDFMLIENEKYDCERERERIVFRSKFWSIYNIYNM